MLKYIQRPLGATTVNVARMGQERAERARQVMRKHGIPALLATGARNIVYLTGYGATREIWRQAQYTLFFAEDKAVVFAQDSIARVNSELFPGSASWHWRTSRNWMQGSIGPGAAQKEAKLFAQEIHQELSERGLAGERLGVACFDDLGKTALREEHLTIEDGWPLLMEANTIKTQDEIACLAEAAAITEAGLQAVKENLKPGVTPGEVGRIARIALDGAGSQTPFAVIMAGPLATWRIGGRADYRIEKGDLVIVCLCCNSYMGYASCVYRTFIAGREPNAKEKDMYNRLRDRVTAAIEATKVGNTTADAAKAFPPASARALTADGTKTFKDEIEQLAMEIGHGLGLVADPPALQTYLPPMVQREWSLEFPQPFEKGMVIAYESHEGEPGIGGVRLEHMVVVTDDGPEIMDFWPGDEITVAGV